MSSSSPPNMSEAPEDGQQPGRYYGRGIPYLPINGYPGKLIAIDSAA